MSTTLDALTDLLGKPRGWLDGLYPQNLYQQVPPIIDRTAQADPSGAPQTQGPANSAANPMMQQAQMAMMGQGGMPMQLNGLGGMPAQPPMPGGAMPNIPSQMGPLPPTPVMQGLFGNGVRGGMPPMGGGPQGAGMLPPQMLAMMLQMALGGGPQGGGPMGGMPPMGGGGPMDMIMQLLSGGMGGPPPMGGQGDPLSALAQKDVKGKNKEEE